MAVGYRSRGWRGVARGAWIFAAVGGLVGCAGALHQVRPAVDGPAQEVGWIDTRRAQACLDSEGAPGWWPWARGSGCGVDEVADARCALLGDPEPCLERGQALLEAGALDGALARFQAACDQGAGEGCHEVTLGIETEALPGAPGQARAAAERGCAELEHPGSCASYAHYFVMEMREGAPDTGKAAQLAAWSCEAGDDFGCDYLKALCHGEELGSACHAMAVQSEEDESWDWELLARGCALGWGDSCMDLGHLGLKFGAEGTVEVLERGCLTLDHMGSCVNLGLYHAMFSEAADALEQAERHYLRACEAGDPIGCSNLGLLLSEPDAPNEDPARAFRYSRQACELGAARGCVFAAEWLDQGYGTHADPEAALALRARACELGDEQSCEEAGGW